MIYGSVCSGIEAATVAWHSLGWKPAFFSEIDKPARAVLKYHYPNVPLHGDFTTIKAKQYGAINLLVGGTPCQSFSVAGLRKGIADSRGNLALEFLRLAQREKPEWVLWENVPGVYSATSHESPDICPPPAPLDMERDGQEVVTSEQYESEELHAFNCFLGGLSECGYGFAYRTFDAQHFGVPQRRRRVFVVGYLGDWRRSAAVLFERESLRGDITPRREAREDVASTLEASAGRSRGAGTPDAMIAHSLRAQGNTSNREDSQTFIASTGSVAHCLNAGGMGRQDYETETLITHALCGEGFDASEDGTSRGTPLVTIPILEAAGRVNSSIPINTQMGLRGPETSNGPREGMGIGNDGDPMFTLQAQHQHAIAFNLRGREGGAMPEPDDLASLRAASGGSSKSYISQPSMQVRRLIPTECEALQGFKANYTFVPYGKKMMADGPRYKMLGNSMAVPVMHWIGKRIQMVDDLAKEKSHG